MTAARDALGRPVPVPERTDPEVWARFCKRVVMLPADGCHLWCGPPRDDGYGQWRVPEGARIAGDVVKAGPWRAHRLAYSAITGRVLTEEEHLLHECDQPLCCRITPERLERHHRLGDNVDNVADREARGRSTRLGRYGVPIPSLADRRGQAGRSRAIHEVLTSAVPEVQSGQLDLDALAAAVAEADRAGAYEAAQPTLPGLDDLR